MRPRTQRRKQAIGLGLVGTAIGWLGVEIARAPRWTVDDAFIVARYAENLVRHGVFAFNLDGPRVEGITSPLFGLLAIVAVAIGESPITAMTGAGIAACLLGVALVYRLARRMRLSPILAGLAAWIYATLPEHLTHAMAGLETEAFIACELACALAFLAASSHGTERGARAEWSLLVACLVACLLRPEGFAVTAVLVGLVALRAWRSHRLRAFVRRVALGLGVPLGALLASRLAYYHALLPNTFYAKTRGARSWTIAKDFVSLFDDHFLDFAVVAVAAAVIAALLRAGRARTAPNVKALVVASIALIAALVAAYGHPDVMNYSRRFAMHALPWMVVVALAIVAEAEGRVARVRRRHGALVPGLLLGVAAVGVAFLWEPQRELQRVEEIDHMEQHIAVRHSWYEPAIVVLERDLHDRPRPTLAVYPDAGYIPWRTGWKTVDFGRLNDGYLAREAKTPDDVVRYFFAVAPDAVVFSNYGKDRLWNREASRIVEDERFRAYDQRGQWLDGRGWGLTVYVRR